MVVDAVKHVREPGSGVDVVELVARWPLQSASVKAHLRLPSAISGPKGQNLSLGVEKSPLPPRYDGPD